MSNGTTPSSHVATKAHRGKRRRPAFVNLLHDQRGLAALEAALVLPPFLLMLLCIVQLGIYFTMQSALDTGLLATAQTLRLNMIAGNGYVPPAAAALKTSIMSAASGMLGNAGVKVDVRQLPNLASAVVPVSDGFTDWGGTGSVLVVRAQAGMVMVMPITTTLLLASSAIVRRPNY